MKIIIAGAGIGGLTAALCQQHHGHDVIVLEQATALEEIGAGIQIPPNSMKVYQKLGLDEIIRKASFEPQAIESRNGKTGRDIFKVPLRRNAVQRWGAPYFHIYRPDYIQLLADALQSKNGAAIKLGQKLKNYKQTPDGVSVSLEDGSTITGDVLIGADGIHSAVRAQMLGPDKPRFTGNVAWRAVVPVEVLGDAAPGPTACAWTGKGRHCVTYRLRGGNMVNLVAVVERDDWTSESWTEKGTLDDALEDFKGWHPAILNMLKNADQLYKWALYDRPPLARWTDGRVALLGDAAHPMLPFLAQGAAMAVEDSWALAIALAEPNIELALADYQNARLARASRIQAHSRANASVFHQHSLLGRLQAHSPAPISKLMGPKVFYKNYDYLYGYDVTAPR